LTLRGFKNQLLCAEGAHEVAKNAVGDADRAEAEASLWRSILVDDGCAGPSR
jgi:hypothetical protein